MTAFTCPNCATTNDRDPPNGEWWNDSDAFDDACQDCGMALRVHVRVEIRLIPAVPDSEEAP